MPLPAAHFRPVQSAVKTANAKVWGVAAVTAQPLAALPLYGCGVPLAGSDRLVQSHSTAGGHWCTAALPDVSLRGAKRRGNLAVHSWITGRPRRKRNCLPEIAPQGHFLALRAQGATAPLGPRNDKSGAFTIVTATGTSRSCGAGRGQPGPYKARAFARRSVQIGSAFPRLPRAQSALAMTNLEALCIPRSMIHSTLAHPA